MSVTDSLYNVIDDNTPEPAASTAETVELPAATETDTTADTTVDVVDDVGSDRKNRKMLFAAAVVIAAIFYVVRPLFDTGAGTSDTGTAVTAGDIRSEVAAVLEDAVAVWLDSPETSRTFAVHTFPAGWLVAANATNVYAGVPIAGLCAIGQIDGSVYGTPVFVGIDETGQACDPAYMANFLAG